MTEILEGKELESYRAQFCEQTDQAICSFLINLEERGLTYRMNLEIQDERGIQHSFIYNNDFPEDADE
jgi:hypothetical protein